MEDFKDKVAVVTGGANGIGFGIAKALASAGTHIVIADIEEDRASRAAKELTQFGVSISAFPCDVSKRNEVERLSDHAWEKFGHVDIIVNNAGVINKSGPMIDGDENDFRWLLDVNLLGEWNGCSIFAKRFIKQGTPAHILNTGSENSLYVGAPYCGFYVTSKHAILGMSEVLRMELPSFIKVSILACGMSATNLGGAIEHRPDQFGGPMAQDEATKEASKQFAKLAMDPDEIGRLAVEGMKRGDFYIVTHPHNRDYIAERYNEILKTFDTYAPRFEGDEKYDVRKLMTQARNTQ